MKEGKPLGQIGKLIGADPQLKEDGVGLGKKDSRNRGWVRRRVFGYLETFR